MGFDSVDGGEVNDLSLDLLVGKVLAYVESQFEKQNRFQLEMDGKIQGLTESLSQAETL